MVKHTQGSVTSADWEQLMNQTPKEKTEHSETDLGTHGQDKSLLTF